MSCTSAFDCDSGLTPDQIWDQVLTKTGDGCYAVRVVTDISLDVDTLNVNMADVEAGIGAATDAAATAGGAGSLNAKLRLITSQLETGVAVVGNIAAVTASFTRPADAIAYTALDTVSDSTSSPAVLTFSNLARVSGGTGYITKARLITDQSTNTARFRLHLFNAAPTAINDNSPFTTLWTNRASSLGYVDFAACSTEGSGSTAARSLNKDDRIAFNTSGSRNIYGILETLDAFTPASAQNFLIELTADCN